MEIPYVLLWARLFANDTPRFTSASSRYKRVLASDTTVNTTDTLSKRKLVMMTNFDRSPNRIFRRSSMLSSPTRSFR
jgi:hypothetical protein